MAENTEELEELRKSWAEHDRKLETSIWLNRQLQREVYTRRARFVLRRQGVLLALGSIVLLVIIIPLGGFIRHNLGMARFLWPAVILDILAVAGLAALNFQMTLALQIDYNQPVAAIQRRLERLKKARIRYIEANWLTSGLVWFSAFVVGVKAFFGVDVYHTFDYGTFDMKWILWNVVFGLAVIPPGIWLVRKLSGGRILKDIAGRDLNEAAAFLAKLQEFESEAGED